MWTSAMKDYVTRLVHKYHDELKAQGYSIRDIKEVKFNRKINTYGTCTTHKDGTITIHISEIAFSGGNEVLKNTLLHELIHGFTDTKDHNAVWYRYAKEIGAKYGVNITQYVSKEERIACKEYRDSRYNWAVTCPKCGSVSKYFRKNKVVNTILRHGVIRCGCGHKGTDFKLDCLKKNVYVVY